MPRGELTDKEQQVEIRMEKLEKEQLLVHAEMPGFMHKLIDQYRLEVYYFEVFECLRKLVLVGIPCLFESGSLFQFTFCLLASFITFGLQAQFKPYFDDTDQALAQICEFEIFLTVLMALVTSFQTGDDLTSRFTRDDFDWFMSIALFAPLLAAFLLESPLASEWAVKMQKKALFGFLKFWEYSFFATLTTIICFATLGIYQPGMPQYLRGYKVDHNLLERKFAERKMKAKGGMPRDVPIDGAARV